MSHYFLDIQYICKYKSFINLLCSKNKRLSLNTTYCNYFQCVYEQPIFYLKRPVLLTEHLKLKFSTLPKNKCCVRRGKPTNLLTTQIK